MIVKDWMEKTYSGNEYNTRPYAFCEDGYGISIQGGTSYHYCDPRRYCNFYDELELGFPTEIDSTIAEFAETPDSTQTVFPYVKIGVVEALIEKHGGIDYKKSIDKHNKKYKDYPQYIYRMEESK